MAVDTKRVVLVVDGGNFKTDVALVGGDGELLSLSRGGTCSPHLLGFDAGIDVLSQLVNEAANGAGLGRDGAGGVTGQRASDSRAKAGQIADVARILLAGADFSEEIELLERRLGALGWASRLVVENDTLALLRMGTDRPWGVAVVCGGGINAIGVAPDGREARFPAVGAITGDWGGGRDLGVAALSAANRSADGRGPVSTLEQAVPQHFEMRTPLEVARAVHFNQISLWALAELGPVVYEQAPVDAAAREILERMADEVSAFAIAALKRLELCDAGADVVLGGGLIRAAPPWMIERIEERLHATAPTATVIVSDEGPIVGAAMLGLDAIGAGAEAIARARVELQDVTGELGQQRVA